MIRKRVALLLLSLGLVFAAVSCDEEGLENVLQSLSSGLTSEEIVKGLKTALDSSAMTSGNMASQVNGYLLNEAIKIAAPPEVIQLKDFLDDVTSNPLANAALQRIDADVSSFLSNNFEDLVVSINRAAEAGAKTAYPILKDAITGMTITDGLNILQGGDTAATHYLRTKTFNELVVAFTPYVEDVVAEGQVSRLWAPVAKSYNSIAPIISGKTFGGYTFTGPKQVDENLSRYITDRGMWGLFYLVGQEEAAIRKDPLKYASDIIRKVFGSREAKVRK